MNSYWRDRRTDRKKKGKKEGEEGRDIIFVLNFHNQVLNLLKSNLKCTKTTFSALPIIIKVS